MKVIATVLVLFVALLVWPPAAAFACEPLSPEAAAAATHTRRTEGADFVLLGTITDTDGRDFAHTATVAVETYYKGNGPAEVTITGFGDGPDCLSPVEDGQRLIFYASGDPAATLDAYYLVGLDAVAGPGSEVIAEIEAAAGQEPVVPAGDGDGEATFGLPGYLLLASGTLCLLVIGAGGFALAFWMRRPLRPNGGD